jgi:co-chaperonin GroES (HSP10)
VAEYPIVPVNNLVLVKPDEVQQRSESGLFVLKKVEDVATSGVILDISPKVVADFRVGDHVSFRKHEQYEVEDDDGVVYFLLDADDIIAITG